MFTSEHLPVVLKSVTLKQNDDRERFAFCKFVLEPFIPQLARELGEEVAGHLFDDDNVPRREVSDISFDLLLPKQRLIAREHPELTPTAMLADVSIQDVRVTRPNMDKPRLRLEFVCIVPLVDRMAIEFVVYSFGNLLYLTFEAMQRTLQMNPGVQDAVDNLIAGGLSSVSVNGDEVAAFDESDRVAAKQRVANRKH